MPADPQAPKVDERRWVLRGQIHGLDANEAVEVVPASLVDELRAERDVARDALREIADALNQHGHYLAYHKIAGILSNGPLATAPGGDREDECFRLRAERDMIRTELDDARSALDDAGVERMVVGFHVTCGQRIRELASERDALRKLGRRVAEELDGHVGTLINYPSVQPLTGWLNRQADELADLARLSRDGGPLPDDEYEELGRERDALRAEVERAHSLLDIDRIPREEGGQELLLVVRVHRALARLQDRIRELAQQRDEVCATVTSAIEAARAEGARQEREKLSGEYAVNVACREFARRWNGRNAGECMRNALAAVLS